MGLAGEAELPGNGAGGDAVVAGDHLHLDAGGVAAGDGLPRLGAGRVDDADEGVEGDALHPRQQIAGRVELAGGDQHQLFKWRHASSGVGCEGDSELDQPVQASQGER